MKKRFVSLTKSKQRQRRTFKVSVTKTDDSSSTVTPTSSPARSVATSTTTKTVTTAATATATLSVVPNTPLSALVTSSLVDEDESLSTHSNSNSNSNSNSVASKQTYQTPPPLGLAPTRMAPMPNANSVVGSDIVLPARRADTHFNHEMPIPRGQTEISNAMANMSFNGPNMPNMPFNTPNMSNNSLVDVDTGLDAPVGVFLQNFRENGSELICSVYLMKHQIRQNAITGALSTSLPEDLFSIVDTQLTLLDEYVHRSGIVHTEQGDEVLIDGILSIIRSLWFKQTHFRNSFLQDLEECVGASNDFLRMVEKVTQVLHECSRKYPHLAWLDTPVHNNSSPEFIKFDQASIGVLRREAGDLIALYGSDAVLAAQKASTYVMVKIEGSSIPDDLFSKEWEDTWTQNQVVVSIVRTFEDFLSDIHNWYDQDYMYHKTIVALVQATVSFYVKCMVRKAQRIRRRINRRKGLAKFRAKDSDEEDAGFLNASRAITRIMYDIEVLRDYFGSIAKQSIHLSRAVSSELSVLSVLLECLWLAVGGIDAGYQSSLEEFIVVIHKRTGGHSHVTQNFLSDLWALTSHEGNGADAKEHFRVIAITTTVMQTELTMVTERLREQEADCPWKVSAASQTAAVNVTGVVTLQEFLRDHYDEANFQTQARRGCGGMWDVKSAFVELRHGHRNHNDEDKDESENYPLVEAETSYCCTPSVSEQPQRKQRNPLRVNMSSQGTKDLFSRVQAFQKNLFPSPTRM